MTLLLEFKEKLRQVYAKYSTFLLPVLKFILAMAVFKSINMSLDFVEQLDSIFILLILSLICSIMPLNTMVVFGIFLIVAQCYGIGIEVAGFALALILIMVILYIRFTPQDALILILTPILLPIVTAIGMNPIHFGIMMVVNLAIGFVTPPIGVNLFVASSLTDIPVMRIAKKAMPMIAFFLMALLVITFVPAVSTIFL